MCGIAGYAGPGARRVSPAVLSAMCDRILHRGPDSEGRADRDGVHMGMRRLAVIDLVTGDQPIQSANGSVWVTYNGELYNFRALREELRCLGYRFHTDSDTEVIATGFEAWGEALFARLNGMFAFALHDTRDQRLHLVRDHMGIKPLYVAALPDAVVWGSEIKSLLAYPGMPRRLDTAALREFLAWEYVPDRATLLRDVRKVPAGHSLCVDLATLSVAERCYWRVGNAPEDPQPDAGAWTEQIERQLRGAVRDQLVSDVPLGAFLSGGVDSSLVAAYMGRAETFSIGFEDPSYNELDYAEQVAAHLGMRHTSEVIEPDAVELFDTLMWHMDDPIADFSIFPTYLVSALTRRHVTVALSGDGGDELFGGYDSYLAQSYAQHWDRLPEVLRRQWLPGLAGLLPPTRQKKGLINKVRRFVEASALPRELGHARFRLFADEAALSRLLVGEAAAPSDLYGHITRLRRACSELDPINQALFIDAHSYLIDNCLVKVDRMSMACSLETRVPFLDPELITSCFRMPGQFKLHGGTTKPLLKTIAARHVPRDCVYRNKEGFSIPIKQWLQGRFRPASETLPGIRPACGPGSDQSA